MDQVGGMVSGRVKCLRLTAHCFYHYHVSSASDHQALDPGGWGTLLQGVPGLLCVCLVLPVFEVVKVRRISVTV